MNNFIKSAFLLNEKGCQITMLFYLQKAHLPARVIYLVPSKISQAKLVSSSPRTVRIIQKHYKRGNKMMEKVTEEHVVLRDFVSQNSSNGKKKSCFFSQHNERDLSKNSESRTPHWFYLIKQGIKHNT